MTLLKFAIALLTTMVVAVDLSPKPDNSLAFAQLGEELSPEEEAFRNKAEVLIKDLNFMQDQIYAYRVLKWDAEKKAQDNELLAEILEKANIDRTKWVDYGYTNQKDLEAQKDAV